MRVVLGGEGGPIPTIAIPDPRSDSDLPTQAFLLNNGVPFLKTSFVDQGYTHVEIWCVGAAGGKGGNTPFRDHANYNDGTIGGAGGGGGLHRVLKSLSELPDSCPVVVGVAGADGAYNDGVHQATPGGNGGVSSVNGTTCRASGGGGGAPGPGGFSPGGNGGAGGSGGRTTPGGGAINGANGTWDGTIGTGGSGGKGGSYFTNPDDDPRPNPNPDILYEAEEAGHGSYSLEDTSVYGARQSRSLSTSTQIPQPPRLIVPGSGGGARISTLMAYGSRAPSFNPNGAVFIRIMQIF